MHITLYPKIFVFLPPVLRRIAGALSRLSAEFKVALGEGEIDIVLGPAQPRSRLKRFLPQPTGIPVDLEQIELVVNLNNDAVKGHY